MKVNVTKKGNSQRKILLIHTEFIKLESALKLANIVESGGLAKNIIQDGLVCVNGEVCLMRGKKLYDKDTFSLEGVTYEIKKNET